MIEPAPAFERPAARTAEFRGRPGVVRFLDLPPPRAVMIDGDGPPGPKTFGPRMPGLYTTAYKLRFGLKDRDVITRVGPLLGLWWTASGRTDLDAIFAPGRTDWRCTPLICLPDEAGALRNGCERSSVRRWPDRVRSPTRPRDPEWKARRVRLFRSARRGAATT